MSFPRFRRGADESRRDALSRRDARSPGSPEDERARRVLALQWALTSGTSLFAAVLAGLRAMTATPSWDRGDLLVGLYFAALSLLLWARSAWIRRGRSITPGTSGHLAALAVGLGAGAALMVADIATSGRL